MKMLSDIVDAGIVIQVKGFVGLFLHYKWKTMCKAQVSMHRHTVLTKTVTTEVQ